MTRVSKYYKTVISMMYISLRSEGYYLKPNISSNIIIVSIIRYWFIVWRIIMFWNIVSLAYKWWEMALSIRYLFKVDNGNNQACNVLRNFYLNMLKCMSLA